ncbi:hypothetical protein BSKO_01567 [Bryopsis sp. KO-2023]|nr:hypothetical protein BSKO_01567 [Bryopsis sp. KO-2023]
MPIGFAVRGVWCLSRLFVGRAVRVVRRNRKVRPPPVLSLPVAGLDEPSSQSILFSLRQAAADGVDEDLEVAELWLATLELTQIVSDRLMQDLLLIDESLSYWRDAMAQGGHFLSIFLRNGPIMFYNKVKDLISGETEKTSATDMLEERVVALRALRTLLSEAIGEIQKAAGGLRLRVATEAAHQPTDFSEEGKKLLSSARAAVTEICDVLFKTVKSLQEDVGGFGDIDAAKAHMKNLAIQKTRSGVTTRDTMVDGGSSLPENGGIGGTDISSLWLAIGKVQDLLGVDMGKEPGRSVNKAVGEGAILTAEANRIVEVPKWTKCPGMLQRNWLESSIMGLISLWGFGWLLRHSPLMGSRAMYNWANGIKFAFIEHILGPLKAVRNELFDTFRNSPSIVSRGDYEISRESLLRMLQEFERDHKGRVKRLPGSSSKNSTMEVMAGMETLMRAYEAELKNPIFNVVGGSLARALLIQVQKLKTDTEAAMLQLDSILRANELNVALIAAIPSVVIAGGLVYFTYKSINNSGPDPFVSATPCRMNLVELHRTLSKCKDVPWTAEAEGLVAFRLYKVYESCWNVFKNRDRVSSNSEWPTMTRDMIEIAQTDVPIKQKIKICERMQSTYRVFKVVS